MRKKVMSLPFRVSILLLVIVEVMFHITAGATTLYSSNTTSLCNAANSNVAVVDASGYFTSRLPWSCDDVFDCLVEFLSCVNGTLSLCPTDNTSLPGHYPLTMDCSAFGPNVNALMLQQCLRKRVQCTLNAAQNALWVSNASCRSWGAPLSNEYNSLYELVVNNTAFHAPPVGPLTADNISLWDNYTATCVVDMCAIASNGIRRTIEEGLTNSNNTNTSTTSLQLQNVDIGSICSVNLSYPIIPLNADDIPGCPVVSSITHPYFINVPITSCSAPAACLASYCSCLGGVWDTKATSCDTSRLLDTSTAVARSCFAIVMSCILNSALSIYIPGTSPLVPDPCLSWSVLIAQDYSLYYNTVRSSVKSTSLWQACNATACRENAGLIGIAGVTSSFLETACAFPGVSARPTFQAYDPCPYQCPNGQCTVGIMYCSCTASAGITNLQASFVQPFTTTTTGFSTRTFDLSFSLTASAFATYKSLSVNCTDYDYSPFMSFLWQLYSNDTNSSSSSIGALTPVYSSNRSSLVISAASRLLQHDTSYLLVLSVVGILPNQTASKSWKFTAMAPTPIVSITTLGSQLRVPNSRPLVITAVIVDSLPSAGTASYNWSCVVLLNGTQPCPPIVNETQTSMTFPANDSVVGTFRVTYLYRDGVAQSSLVVIFVAGDLPYVRVLVSGTRLTTTNIAVGDTFLATQTVNIAAVVSFGSGNAVTYAWARGTVGSTAATTIPASSASASVSIAASQLSKASFSSVASGTPNVVNWIRVRVSSTINPSQYGEASVSIVVMEPMILSLAAFRVGSNSSSMSTTLVGLQDLMQLQPSVAASSDPLTPITSEDLGPYGSALGYSFSYVDSVTRPDGTASSASVGLAVTPTAGAVDTFTVLAPLFSSTALTTAAVTITVSLSFGGVVADQANATVAIVAPSDISGVVAAESAKVSAISDPAAAVVMANTLRCLTAWSSTTVQQYLGVATLTLLSRVLSNDDVALLAASDKISILASISSSLVAIEGISTSGSSSRTFHAAAASLTSAAITGTAAQQKISYSLLIQPLVIAALKPSADTVDSLSFAYDNYDLILAAIQSMDMSTGGNTAIHLASAVVNAPDLLVGTSMTISSSGTILISVVKELASTLKSATSVGSEGGSSGTVTFRFSGSSGNGVVLNGASLVIPSMTNASDISVLPWTTLQDTDVVGIAATVLSTNPFTTTTTSTLKVASSIVVVDMLLTSPTGAPSALTVSDMPEDQAWVVTIPNAGQGVSCGYFDDELKNWAKTGVTILLPNASTTPPSAPSTSLQCLTTHLTAFGGIPASSAASTSSVTAIVTAIMAVVVVCFI